MPSFRDNQDREWNVELTVTEISRLRKRLGVNLLDGYDVKTKQPRDILRALTTDWELLVNALYVICEPQCVAAGVSDEDFGRSLLGEHIEAATTALVEALCDFFQNTDRGRILRLATNAEKTMQTVATLDAVLSRFGGSASSLPQSPDSNPTAAPSAS